MKALLLALVAFTFAACGATTPRDPPAALRASCPPLTPPPVRNDSDAQTRRIAELETWYRLCRDEALTPAAAAAVGGPKLQRFVGQP